MSAGPEEAALRAAARRAGASRAALEPERRFLRRHICVTAMRLVEVEERIAALAAAERDAADAVRAVRAGERRAMRGASDHDGAV